MQRKNWVRKYRPEESKELLTDEAKKYKKLIRSKMRKFRKDLNEKIRVLHFNDTKRYWEVLNQCNKARGNPPPPQKKNTAIYVCRSF